MIEKNVTAISMSIFDVQCVDMLRFEISHGQDRVRLSSIHIPLLGTALNQFNSHSTHGSHA